MSESGTSARRVVVGVDCTEESEALLRWADRQAELTGSTLVAVTGWKIQTPGLPDFAAVAEVEAATRELLGRAVRAALPVLRAGVAELVVSDRVPAEALIEHSADADLVVVGPRGANPIDGLLLGSVTEKIVSEANCPVVVVHDDITPGDGPIVVGVDGTDCGRLALRWAVREAKLTGTTVRAVMAWEWRPQWAVYPYGVEESTVQKVSSELLDDELSLLPPDEAALVHPQLVGGTAAKVLLKAVDGASLVVVGNHRAGPLAARVLGSVSQKVVRHSGVPVVVVHEHDQHG